MVDRITICARIRRRSSLYLIRMVWRGPTGWSSGSGCGVYCREALQDAKMPRSKKMRALAPFRLTWRRGVAVLCGAFPISCAPPTGYRAPAWARDYQIVVTRDDSPSRGIAAGLRSRGVHGDERADGGGSPAAHPLP